MGVRGVVVSAWGGGHKDALPSIDPASLYVMSILQMADLSPTFVAAPPSLLRGDPVPALYACADTPVPEVGAMLAPTPAAAREFLREHTALDRPLADAPQAASARAVHALLDDEMSDLVLHSLFSLPPNFDAVTAKALVQPGHAWFSSLPRRLRAAVHERLASPHIALWGVGGSWDREERRQNARWSRAAGIRSTEGVLDPSVQATGPGPEDVRETWERSRIAAQARRVLGAVNAALSGEFIGGSSAPTSVDARLYSLLAPLLYTELPIDILAGVLRKEFPRLVEHTQRMHAHLWHGERGWAFERVAVWPAPRVALPSWPSWAAIKAWARPARAAPKAPAEPAPPLPPTLRYGRWLWAATALLGPVLYIWATGLVQIEYVDEDDDELVDDDSEVLDDGVELIDDTSVPPPDDPADDADAWEAETIVDPEDSAVDDVAMEVSADPDFVDDEME